MPPNLFTGFISTDFPIEQAPVDGADGFEDDNLAAPQSPPHNIGARPQRDLGSADWGVFGSMKIVLFKSKLNLLIPCGFLAILIDYTSQNQVISIDDSSICRTSTNAFACLWSFIDVVTLFSEGLGVSSEPVGYNSFGRAIGFRYRVIFLLIIFLHTWCVFVIFLHKNVWLFTSWCRQLGLFTGRTGLHLLFFWSILNWISLHAAALYLNLHFMCSWRPSECYIW